MAKFIIALMIKASFKYLGKVSSETLFQKIGAFFQLFSAKVRTEALKRTPDWNFLDGFFPEHWSEFTRSHHIPVRYHHPFPPSYLMALWNNRIECSISTFKIKSNLKHF